MDIKGGVVSDWLVTGWFTPDYRPLAEKLAGNLSEYSAPFHLWAKPKSERGWNTWRKASVVLETMKAYPGKTIVLMDVDCHIKGDISSITNIQGDVGLTMRGRWVRLFWPPHKRITVKASSRVVVFRPTEGARAFAAEWAELCEATHYGGDEAAMATAILAGRCSTAFSHLDPRFSGVGNAAGSVVSHESAHDAMHPQKSSGWLKEIERRWFRSGRTKAAKQAGLA